MRCRWWFCIARTRKTWIFRCSLNRFQRNLSMLASLLVYARRHFWCPTACGCQLKYPKATQHPMMSLNTSSGTFERILVSTPKWKRFLLSSYTVMTSELWMIIFFRHQSASLALASGIPVWGIFTSSSGQASARRTLLLHAWTGQFLYFHWMTFNSNLN